VCAASRQAAKREEQAVQKRVAREVAADQEGVAAESAWLAVFDESGISLIPPVQRTPSSVHHADPPPPDRRKKASMAAALGYYPDGTKPGCVLTYSPTATTLNSLI
jgi:hypothetical protein